MVAVEDRSGIHPLRTVNVCTNFSYQRYIINYVVDSTTYVYVYKVNLVHEDVLDINTRALTTCFVLSSSIFCFPTGRRFE